MTVYRHGINMVGLKKAAGYTKSLSNGRGYVQISYDKSDGQILTDWHFDVNSWKNYKSESIRTVANATSPMSMQDIADAVAFMVSNW